MRRLLIGSGFVALVLALLGVVPNAWASRPDASVTEFPLPHGDSRPYTIVTGPDGNLWFTEELGNDIVRLDPSNPGDQTHFALPTDGELPWDIKPGPDGNLWFTELAGHNVGKITTAGAITEYPVPGDSGIAG